MEISQDIPLTEEDRDFVRRMVRPAFVFWNYEETAPINVNVLISDGHRITVGKKEDDVWFSHGLPFAETVKYWMPLPRAPEAGE